MRTGSTTTAGGVRQTSRLAWPDAIRVLATATIFAFHFSGDYWRLAGGTTSRVGIYIQQNFNLWGIAAFVVLGGFSLTLSSATRAPGYRDYAARRLTRLLAPYWTVAIPFIIVGFAVGEAPLSDWWKVPVWLFGLGPVSRATYLPISQVWWFVSLALQISLLMPLVTAAYRRLGPVPTTLAAVALNYLAFVAIDMAAGSWEYLDQGLVFARLCEVMAGVLAANIVLKRRQDGGRIAGDLVAAVLLMVALPFVYRLGHFTPWAMVVALALVFLACALCLPAAGREYRWLGIAAAYTYCFYLSHAPVTKYTLQALFGRGVDELYVTLPIVLALTVAIAWAAETLARRYATPLVGRAVRRILKLPPAKAIAL